jgi:hypothetical protein
VVLLDQNVENSDINLFLQQQLNIIFDAGRELPVLVRRFQDFYMLWHILSDVNQAMAKSYRREIKESLIEMFRYMKKPGMTDPDMIMRGFSERRDFITDILNKQDIYKYFKYLYYNKFNLNDCFSNNKKLKRFLDLFLKVVNDDYIINSGDKIRNNIISLLSIISKEDNLNQNDKNTIKQINTLINKSIQNNFKKFHRLYTIFL